jgi:hypothetical protein
VYNFWQFIHVTAATVWVGASILTTFLTYRLGAQRENPVAGPAMGLMMKTAVPLFAVASLLTLITGLVMAFGWVTFDPLWIKIGLAGVIVSIVLGFGYHRPHGAKVESIIQEKGPGDPAALALVRQGNTVALVELAFLIVVVWAMVAKPA